jgi:hypothetical protein
VHEFKQGIEDAKREINRPIDSDSKTNDEPKAKDVD